MTTPRAPFSPRRWLFKLALMSVSSLALTANQATAQTSSSGTAEQPFEEAIEVHEVRLTVRVDNVMGAPVDGLTVSDFSVREDGVPVEIVNFRRLGSGGGTRADGAAPAEPSVEDADSSPEPAVPEDSLVVLLFDVREVHPKIARAVGKTADWIRENPDVVDDHTWMTVILDTGIGVLGSPTSDANTLAEAVETIRKRKLQDRVWRYVESPADSAWVQEARAHNELISGSESILDEDARERLLKLQRCSGKRHWMLDQIEQVRQLIESLAPIAGRKKIVWMHSSNLTGYDQPCDNYHILQVAREIQDLGAIAAASGVVMHASSLGGLELKYGGAKVDDRLSEYLQHTAPVAPYYEHMLSLGGLARNMAIHTGGQRVGLNDPSYIFQRAFEDPVYEMTVLVPHPRDGFEHKIDIELAGHPAAMLQYQRSYLDLSKRQLLMNQLERFSLLPGTYGTFPVHLRWQASEAESEDYIALQVTVAVPANRVGLVERDDQLVAEIEPWVAVHRLDGELVEMRQLDSDDVSLPVDTFLDPSAAFAANTAFDLPAGEYLITGAYFDRLNETSGVTSARLELGKKK